MARVEIFTVAPEGRYLAKTKGEFYGYGAVLYAGGNGVFLAEDRYYLLGQCVGTHIVIRDRTAEHAVPYTSADAKGRKTVFLKPFDCILYVARQLHFKFGIGFIHLHSFPLDINSVVVLFLVFLS